VTVRRWFLPFAFVVTALLPSIAFAAPQLLCTMGARPHCCCPQQPARTHAPVPEQTVRAQSCCTASPAAPASSTPAADTRTGDSRDALAITSAAVVVTAVPDPIASLRAAVASPRATAPPPSGSVLVRHCVFLL